MALSFYLFNDELPNWTEFVQVVIATLGMIATVITLYKLMKKDKQRESEIASLSLIAFQLKEMLSLNEKRYVESQIPHIEVECKKDEVFRSYFLHFRNTNPNSRITEYKRTDSRGLEVHLATRLSDNGDKQEFSFSINTKKDVPFNIEMTYIVNDKYIYTQELSVHKSYDTYAVHPFQIKLADIKTPDVV